jgi:hypothetical protein
VRRCFSAAFVFLASVCSAGPNRQIEWRPHSPEKTKEKQKRRRSTAALQTKRQLSARPAGTDGALRIPSFPFLGTNQKLLMIL